MTTEMEIEKLKELQTAYRERDEAAKCIATLDKRIAELMGMVSQAKTRKTKTFSPKSLSGCAELWESMRIARRKDGRWISRYKDTDGK